MDTELKDAQIMSQFKLLSNQHSREAKKNDQFFGSHQFYLEFDCLFSYFSTSNKNVKVLSTYEA